MKVDELLDCPFCGSKDTQLHPHYGQASCRKCHATLEVGGFGWHHKPEDARIAWNRRACIPVSKLEELRQQMSSTTLHGGSVERLEAEEDCRNYYVGLVTKLIDEIKNDT